MPRHEKDLAEVFDDTREVTRRMGRAVREAVLEHKRAGNSIAVWRDGKVVIVPPEEIFWDNTPPRKRKKHEAAPDATQNATR